MRVGIYGGTFNPVHNGHIKLAQAYTDGLRLDELLIIPTRIPPHKQAPDLIDGAHRLAMCKLAFAECPSCTVSGMELERKGKSYTVDTLEEIKRERPDDELYLIMGSDMFLTLTEWFNWERIFELAVMCAGARTRDVRGQLDEYQKYLETLGAKCQVIDLDPVPVSSTMVRECTARGKEIISLVPAAVAEYIAYNGLYQ